MEYKPIKCPACGKTLIFHVDGCNATYSITCVNNKCNARVIIYSAGQTAIQEGVKSIKDNLTFKQLENMVAKNKGIDLDKIITRR